MYLWKGVVRYDEKGKLALRFVGLFDVSGRSEHVACRLELTEELSSVHDTFHVSKLKECVADASLHVPLDVIMTNRTLRLSRNLWRLWIGMLRVKVC